LVLVAQLDRASASEAEGYRFDPCREHSGFSPLFSCFAVIPVVFPNWNGSDYTLIDDAFNRQNGSLLAQAFITVEVSLNRESSVPEPAALGLVSLGCMVLGTSLQRCRGSGPVLEKLSKWEFL
jgi:hypothetical protein